MFPTSGNNGRRSSKTAFSLLEILVATAVLMIMILMLAAVIDRTSSLWRRTRDQVQSFQNARVALDSIGGSLPQAVLNPSIEYFQNGEPRQIANTNFSPDAYGRYSDLVFFTTNNGNGIDPSMRSHAVFFEAPLGYATNSSNIVLPRLLNFAGYYVQYGSDLKYLPSISALSGSAKKRFRLMQYLQPTEDFNIYIATNSAGRVDTSKVIDKLKSNLETNSRILSENVIALIVQPKSSSADTNGIAPDFSYDSRQGDLTNVTRHQLPPIIGITIVAINEESADRLDRQGNLQAKIDQLLAGKFLQANALSSDLAQLETQLSDEKIDYRIFNADIAIRSARWSEQ